MDNVATMTPRPKLFRPDERLRKKFEGQLKMVGGKQTRAIEAVMLYWVEASPDERDRLLKRVWEWKQAETARVSQQASDAAKDEEDAERDAGRARRGKGRKGGRDDQQQREAS